MAAHLVQLSLFLAQQSWYVSFLSSAVGLANELHPSEVFRLDTAFRRNAAAAFFRVSTPEEAVAENILGLGTVLGIHPKQLLDEVDFGSV